MKSADFRRRMMTDPNARSVEMREARARDPECARLAAASDRFEARLRQALEVPVPRALADRIVLEQSFGSESRWRSRWGVWGSIAASLFVAVIIAAMHLHGPEEWSFTSIEDLQQHVQLHWQYDGDQMLAVAATEAPDLEQIERVLSAFGVALNPALRSQVRAATRCPTPNGYGAHLVLATDEGPITMYYMPRTRAPQSPVDLSIDSGRPSMVVNLARGSMTLIGSEGSPLPELAQVIAEQLAFSSDDTI